MQGEEGAWGEGVFCFRHILFASPGERPHRHTWKVHVRGATCTEAELW